MIGSMHFSGVAMLEETLLATKDFQNPVVILHLCGLDNAGSTFIRVVERNTKQLFAHGRYLFLIGVHNHVYQQLQLTDTTDTILEEDIKLAE